MTLVSDNVLYWVPGDDGSYAEEFVKDGLAPKRTYDTAVHSTIVELSRILLTKPWNTYIIVYCLTPRLNAKTTNQTH